MSDAFKCSQCGEFFEGHGYSILICKDDVVHSPENDAMMMRSLTPVRSQDDFCEECMYKAAAIMEAAHILPPVNQEEQEEQEVHYGEQDPRG